MTKIQEVALALKANLAKQFDAKPLLGDAASGDWHATGGVIDLEEMARAAIEAMREPTDAMIGACEAIEGGKIINDYYGEGNALWISEDGRKWWAMIDAALAEEGSPATTIPEPQR
jgi:hypothetical protein